MGIATETATPPLLSHSNNQISIIKGLNSLNSMSQGFHPAIYSTFSNGFDTPLAIHQDQDQTGELPAVYETGGMLSEMFSFQSAAAPAANLLDNQILESFRLHRSAAEWPPHNRHNIAQHHQIPAMNADSAAAMQLFLMKPQPRSPSPPPPASFHSAFDANPIPPAQFTWITDSGGADSTDRSKIEGAVESQGLSLSLSPLQHLEVAKKAEELRIGDGAAVLYYNQGGGGGGGVGGSAHHHFSNSFQLKNLETSHHEQGVVGQNHHHQVHVGFSPSLGMVNVLRNSKYLKAAQELLEEICSVGRGQLKNNRPNTNPNKNTNNQNSSGGGGGSSSASKDLPPLSAADRIQYQRRKAALLSILDEVDRRYNYYCGQMQMVVNSFDSIMGYGAARPYTAMAQKAMSRHFRYLKDAIAAQLKQTRELLGEKEGVGATGITKGETPRLKLLDQSLRQQRAFHQMGMMEQEAWRPQRGLPESSVNILRAWLFEHFLHPYPSDADKHLLARQTGLSRNQVSNWFINARVRLWKPMVEEMYQQESKDQEGDDGGGHGHEEKDTEKNKQLQGEGHSSSSAQTPTLSSSAATATATTTTTAAGKRSEINAQDNDPSLNAINIHRFSENQAGTTATTIAAVPQHNNNSLNTSSPTSRSYRLVSPHDYHHHRQNQQLVTMSNHVDAHEGHYGTTTTPTSSNGANTNIVDSAPLLMFGSSATTTPDHVSLTLGLRHAGNLPDNNRFPLTDYGSY